MTRASRRWALVGATAALALAFAGCTDAEPARATEIVVWAHDGTDAERVVLERQVADFNASQDDVEVTLRLESEGSYNDLLQAATSGDTLPDVAEVDGPLLAGYVHQRALVPLDGLVDEQVLDDQLPSLEAQGEFDGHRYAVGVFDSGLGLYADRRALRAARVAWPRTVDDAWTAREFSAALAALSRRDPDGRVLDVKANYGTGEWLTYGFAPLVASAGGALMDPDSLSPSGWMDGAAAARALDAVRAWSSYVDPNEHDDAFVERRVALSWVGHWTYRDYAAALGRDLLVLPLPDLGHGARTGQGSWAWTVTARDRARQDAAARFLEFLLTDEEVRRMTDANGAVPGTRAALAASTLYGDGGPLTLLAEQLLRSCGSDPAATGCVAVPRPRTPGYAVLSSQFAQAVAVALGGKDPRPALRSGVAFVEDDLRANDGFAVR